MIELVPIALIGGAVYLLTRKPAAAGPTASTSPAPGAPTPKSDPISQAINSVVSAITGSPSTAAGRYSAQMLNDQNEMCIRGSFDLLHDWERYRQVNIQLKGRDLGATAPPEFLAYVCTNPALGPGPSQTKTVTGTYNQMTAWYGWQAVTAYSDGSFDVVDISPSDYAAAGITPDSVQHYLRGMGYHDADIDAALCAMFGLNCSVYTPPIDDTPPATGGNANWNADRPIWQFLRDWQEARRANGEDPCSISAFREHLVGIGYGDPGDPPYSFNC